MSTRREFLRIGTGALIVATGGPALGSTQAAPLHTDYTPELEAARAGANVTGASFAYWDGRTLHIAVSGLRNSVTRDPVTNDTLMHVGSITKVTNAALMMQLVDDGLIALDDPVLQHIPELRTRDMAALRNVTCAMLVNHTSGIDGEWLPEYGPDQERIVDTIERCASLGQLFAPGEMTSYNNVATVIAGYLSQKLRGKSWYTLVRQRIYEPLEMRHALVDPLDVPRFRISVGDLTEAATGKMVQTTRPFLAPSFAPAGTTQMTSASDLVMLARTLIGGGVGTNGVRILSQASATAMMTPSAEYVRVGRTVDKVGLGWGIRPGGVVSHGGGGPGVRSTLVAHPASGRAVALLTNCDKGDVLAATFLDPIVESWTGIKAHEPLRRLTTAVNPSPYVGTYENNADRYIIAARDGALSLRTYDKMSTYDNSNQDRPDTALYFVGDDTFEGKSRTPGGSDITMRFVRPGVGGKMRFLANGGRLLARVT
jgi:CubicO group peptidase (beta-lactamase class C family)